MAGSQEKKAPIAESDLPPTPPDSNDSVSISSSDDGSSVPFPLPPRSTVPEVQEQDKKTPDSHVPRDSRLIRLTGVHPFNVEAPLSELFNQGFLTSPELFYVRNHGAVPEVRDEDVPSWEFTVEGLVENPVTISLKELISEFDNVTYPITLVCAGNRRKEQNVVKKTKGFSWGAAGVSTALFTGVKMSDVINLAKPKRGARYVCMEGADQLPNGKYETSVKLNWVMDPNRGIMLAHGMNGEMLRPDHGKPLRAVIPGQIGGRSVKWLKRLILTTEPSDNWYHIYDNRVLPTSVSPEESANNKAWWTDERYAIFDLNNNSAIAYPAHDEQLSLDDSKDSYRIKGYAYAGGGRRITRAEISLDKAETWRLAEVEYPEDTYRDAESCDLFGGRLDMSWRETSFCWCFWHLDVPLEDLQGASDILVRTMDDAMAIQPRDMYWSVMGMMNNPWYRVAIVQEQGLLRFEHPTQPAQIPGGWMERVKKAGGNLMNGHWGERVGNEPLKESSEEAEEEVKMTNDDVKREISVAEVKEHENEESPWFVLNGEVYDGTAFLEDHPGGPESIICAAATDATEEFMAIHSENAKLMMPKYHVGTLNENPDKLNADVEDAKESRQPSAQFLHHKVWKKTVLYKKVNLSWDTRLFTFKLEHEEQSLGLPTGQHLMIKLQDPATREVIIRPYTPVSHESSPGFVDVLVKLYFDTADRKGGKMTMSLDSLPVGHPVEFKGPIGKFTYLGGGRCSINGNERHVDSFVMICGGSGVTPIYQVFRAVATDEDDPTQCLVLDGNRLFEDILCREDLDRFASIKKEKCKVVHTLTQAPDGWEGRRGRIDAKLIGEYISRQEKSIALICGPEPMEKSVYSGLKEQGWKDEDLFFF